MSDALKDEAEELTTLAGACGMAAPRARVGWSFNAVVVVVVVCVCPLHSPARRASLKSLFTPPAFS